MYDSQSTIEKNTRSARLLIRSGRTRARFIPLDAKDPKMSDYFAPEEKRIITIENMLDVHPRIFYKWLDAQEIQH